MEKIKVLIIYCLEDIFDDECTLGLKERFKVDLAICVKANNQLSNIQYPYFVVETFEH